MSGSIFHPFVLDNAAGQETVVGIGSDSEKYGVGISSHTHITGIQTVDGFLHAGGGIKDTSGDLGNSGQVLSSTGSGLNWINPGDASVENASNIGVNLYSVNADQFVTFVGASSGNNPIRVDAGIKYNPSTGTLSATTFSGGGAVTINNNGDNRIITGSATAGELNGESSITYDGTKLNLGDNKKITFGNNLRMEVYTDGSVNYIKSATDGGGAFPISIHSGSSEVINIDDGHTQIKTGLKDKDGDLGSSGQVLSSTGTQVNWINVGDLAAGSAAQVAVSDESADQTCFPLFVTASTGNQSPKSGSNLTFNSSTGALSATSFSGSIAASNVNSGTLADARIPSLNASKINAGTFADARIPSLAASKITSGTLGTDRIPSLAASKITSGQFDTARIPTLNQNTTGTAAGLSGSPSITVTNITIDGQLRDGDNGFGSSGQVLSSDGTDTKWINAGSLSAGAAALVAVNATNSTNSSHFIAFTETSSGNEEIRVDNSLTYNPSTNVLTAGTFSGSGASLTNLPAGNLTGTVADARISTLTASKLTGALPAIDGSALTGIVSDKIFEGNSEVEVIDTGSLGLIKFVTEGDERLRIDSSGHLKLPNNAFIRLGDAQTSSGTLRIYSNGTQSYISPGITGNHIRFLNSGSTSQVELYFGTGQKLSTQSYGILVQGNVSATNNLSCNNNLLCSGTASVANTLTVTGSEGTDAILELLADDGDDNDDKWRIRSDATGNDLKFETYTSGSWSDGSPLQLAGNGIVTMPGQAVIDEVNINGNVVQTNTSNELVVRGKGTGGSHHLKLDDDVTIVGDLTVQGVGGFVTGMILLWSGAANAIPSGWVLCNGQNSTPDLRGRFVVGYSNTDNDYDVGDTGGNKQQTLSINQIPSHTHSYSSANHPTSSGPEQNQSGGPEDRTTFNVSKTTGSTGGGQPVDVRPPYYALCYIMKT